MGTICPLPIISLKPTSHTNSLTAGGGHGFIVERRCTHGLDLVRNIGDVILVAVLFLWSSDADGDCGGGNRNVPKNME